MSNKLPTALVFLGIPTFLTAFAVFAVCASQGAAQSPQESVLTCPSKADPASVTPPGMTYIPGGVAIIGLDEQEIQEMKLESMSELNVLAGSAPRHQVPIKGFYLDTTEVTNHEWQIYLQATGQEPGEDLVKFSWKDGKLPAGLENHPVVLVSFKEAGAYAAWAGKRLPTEQEWEYAARGAGGFQYPWGNEFDGAKAHCAVSKMVGGRRAQEAGTKRDGQSPFGLLDMAGNVWEWTSSPFVAYDGYQDIQIKTKYTKNRKAAYSATSQFSGQRRVIRGGAWNTRKVALMSALRQAAEMKQWNTTIGFRCAKSAQAGVETLAEAKQAVGRHYFKGHALDLRAAQVKEVTQHDGTHAVLSHQGIAFAPIRSWKSFSTVRKKSKRDPVVAGLLYTSEEIVVPRLAPGAYWLAYQAGDKKAKRPKGAEFPEEGWVYHGWKEHDTGAKAKPGSKSSKRSPKKSGQPKGEADDKADDDKANDKQPDNQERYEASEGSVVYDRQVDNLLLINRSNKVLAALPLEEVSSSARPAPSELDVQKMGPDELRKLPATERYTYAFTITLPGKAGVRFELPLRFHPDPLAADPPSSSKVGTSKR